MKLVSIKTGGVSLAHLKQQYLDIEASWTRTHAEIAHKLGRVLLQIREHFPHGDWLPWVEKNLSVSDRTARRLMQVASLPALPKRSNLTDFDVLELAAVATIAQRDSLSPDDAAAKFIEQREAKERAPAQPKLRVKAEREDDRITEKDHLNNYLMRASTAKELAYYSGQASTQQLVIVARRVAEAWSNLATKLEEQI